MKEFWSAVCYGVVIAIGICVMVASVQIKADCDSALIETVKAYKDDVFSRDMQRGQRAINEANTRLYQFQQEQVRTAYSAWIKLHQGVDITFDEWQALRATGSL